MCKKCVIKSIKMLKKFLKMFKKYIEKTLEKMSKKYWTKKNSRKEVETISKIFLDKSRKV